MKPLYILFVGVAILLPGCERHGNKVVVNNGEVYYKDGVSKEEAERVGQLLTREQFFRGERVSVQILKEGNKYVFRVVTPESMINEPSQMTAAKDLGDMIAQEVFNDAPMEVHICDKHLKTVHTASAAPGPNGRKVKFGELELFYKGNVSKDLALKTAQFIVDEKAFESNHISVQLVGEEDRYLFRWIPLENPLPGEVEEFYRQFARKMSLKLFDKKAVVVQNCDNLFNVLSTIKP